jgi:hypothetical protein
MEVPMIYTMREIKPHLRDRRLTAVAECVGLSYSTLWRLMNDQQEARESTLIVLTKYVMGEYNEAV